MDFNTLFLLVRITVLTRSSLFLAEAGVLPVRQASGLSSSCSTSELEAEGRQISTTAKKIIVDAKTPRGNEITSLVQMLKKPSKKTELLRSHTFSESRSTTASNEGRPDIRSRPRNRLPPPRDRGVKSLAPKNVQSRSRFSRLKRPISRIFGPLRQFISRLRNKVFSSIEKLKSIFGRKDFLTLKQQQAIITPNDDVLKLKKKTKDGLLRELLNSYERDPKTVKKLINKNFSYLLSRENIKFSEGFDKIITFSYLSKKHDKFLVELRWGLIDLQHKILFSKKINHRLLQSVQLVLHSHASPDTVDIYRPKVPRASWDSPWTSYLFYPQNGIAEGLQQDEMRRRIESWFELDNSLKSYYEKLKRKETTAAQAREIIENLRKIAMNKDTGSHMRRKVGAIVLLRYLYDTPLIQKSPLKYYDANTQQSAYSALISLLDTEDTSYSLDPDCFFLQDLILADMPPPVFSDVRSLGTSSKMELKSRSAKSFFHGSSEDKKQKNSDQIKINSENTTTMILIE